MGNKGMSRIFTLVRDFMFRIVNKEFLIFLSFLCLSAAFWLMLTLNETYDREVAVPIRLTAMPKEVVATSETEDTISVTVRDKGFVLLSYMYGNAIKDINIDYKTFDKGNDKCVVTASDFQRLIYPTLFKSTKITAVKPTNYEFCYTKGSSKSVPVKLTGKITADNSHYISKIIFSPEDIKVNAPDNMINDITEAYTEQLDMANLSDTITREVSLKKTHGVRFEPSVVKITICPDVLIEKSFDIPITAINMPEDKTLRTFPSRIKVSFTIGAGMFRSIHKEQFMVVADYNDILAHPSDKCSLRIMQMPNEVRNATLEFNTVDYLIEGK